ncbi:hypothetical protein B0H13DRAFT_2457965 [Mycena leptocephala]|nr:hypothetical protein B0H13DRAFT_2457965 [Mycena leptocephala]
MERGDGGKTRRTSFAAASASGSSAMVSPTAAAALAGAAPSACGECIVSQSRDQTRHPKFSLPPNQPHRCTPYNRVDGGGGERRREGDGGEEGQRTLDAGFLDVARDAGFAEALLAGLAALDVQNWLGTHNPGEAFRAIRSEEKEVQTVFIYHPE